MDERLISYDPRTLEPVGEVPVTPPGEIPALVARSRTAFACWSALDQAERRVHLRAFKQAVLDRGEDVARTIASETGKTATDAYALEVLTSLTVMDHYLRHAARYLRRRRGGSWPFVSTMGWTEFQPRGVAGVISPWNYPFFLSMIPVFTALAAGCSVVLKPSEKAPLSGQLLADVATAAGLPADLLLVAHGGAQVGAALVDQADVVAFTGSTAVGRKVAEAAGRRLIPAILELGGKDPMIVLDDAHVGRAARAAVWSGMLNGGQTCVSTERVYVVDGVYDRFLTALEREFEHVAAGSGDRREIGPLIDRAQFDLVDTHVADAVAKGARLLRGGRRSGANPGLYYEPTLLTEVDHTMALMQEETFGPVLAVLRVADDREAIEMANQGTYGLHASVWGRDRRRAAGVASQLRSGTVAINDVDVNFIMPTIPFGGVGDSGLGVVFGAEGIRSFCHPKGITAARLPVSTTALLGARFPRRRGMGYWKTLARVLFRW
ncbi:MAG: aldehyde dehydrogenase family protein [Acidimicrobiia bacterium]